MLQFFIAILVIAFYGVSLAIAYQRGFNKGINLFTDLTEGTADEVARAEAALKKARNIGREV